MTAMLLATMFVALTASPAAASITWSIVTSPDTATTQSNGLLGVSCTSASACTAVGNYINGSVQQTLIESWNGSGWVVVTSPDTAPTQDNSLSAVSCISASACTAVGYYYNGSVEQTLIESWNGTSWVIVSSPDMATTEPNYLSGVSCTSASVCTAVGYGSSGGGFQSLIESWDGSSWAIVPSPADEPYFLQGVSCTSASACTAVGYYESGLIEQTLIENWNGTSWSIVSSPDTATNESNLLDGVTCTSASACTAVGYFYDGSVDQTLIENWNGTSWSIVSSPDTATNDLLFGVSCTSAAACTAVGDYSSGSVDQTLIENWNGTSWSIVSSPDTATNESNDLEGVSCISAPACTAVGDYSSGSVTQNLILSSKLVLDLGPASLPNGTTGVAYPAAAITATGGSAPYTFGVTAGALPAGLTLNATSGAIGGVPTGSGVSSFTVTATDHNGVTGSKAFSIGIVLGLGPSSLPNGTTGVAYPAATITAIGGIAPYTFARTSGSLPPGLSMSSSGAISGVPTSTGTPTFTFTVTATDSTGTTGSAQFSIHICGGRFRSC